MTAEPRHHTPRSTRPTNGPGVRQVAAAKGRRLMPWQSDAADVALELDPATGLYWYGIVVVTVQRQSGKTDLEGNVGDHRCLTTRRGRVWITMQNGKTVDSWMRDEHFANLEQAHVFGRPGSRDCAYERSRRAGEVGVRWTVTGSTFLTFPPKRDAMHSKQSDLTFVDEAWVHNAQAGADLRQAIRPTMATRPGSQLWVLSTLGDDTSQYLDEYVDLARASLGDPNARVALVDYGLRDDDDPEDLDVVAARHPAYGYTVTMSALQDARAEFGPDVSGWARAYGNRGTRSRMAAFTEAEWAASQRARLVDVPARAGIALDVTPSGDQAAITAGWRATLDGPLQSTGTPSWSAGDGFVEPLSVGPSSRATVDLLVQLARTRRVPLVADRASYGAVELLEAVQRKAPDVAVELLSMGEYAAACTAWDRGIRGDTIHHPGDPALDAAVTVAVRRPMGDGSWGYGRKGSTGSIAPLVSAVVSLAAFDRLPAPVDRPHVR